MMSRMKLSATLLAMVGKRAEVGQDRAVAIDRDDGLVLGQGHAQTDRGTQAHCAQHVEIGGLIVDAVQFLAGQADVADNQMVAKNGRDLAQNFRTDHWSP